VRLVCSSLGHCSSIQAYVCNSPLAEAASFMLRIGGLSNSRPKLSVRVGTRYAQYAVQLPVAFRLADQAWSRGNLSPRPGLLTGGLPLRALGSVSPLGLTLQSLNSSGQPSGLAVWPPARASSPSAEGSTDPCLVRCSRTLVSHSCTHNL
jgi:hypothetical protein